LNVPRGTVVGNLSNNGALVVGGEGFLFLRPNG
jgi:hypothetical protein